MSPATTISGQDKASTAVSRGKSGSHFGLEADRDGRSKGVEYFVYWYLTELTPMAVCGDGTCVACLWNMLGSAGFVVSARVSLCRCLFRVLTYLDTFEARQHIPEWLFFVWGPGVVVHRLSVIVPEDSSEKQSLWRLIQFLRCSIKPTSWEPTSFHEALPKMTPGRFQRPFLSREKATESHGRKGSSATSPTPPDRRTIPPKMRLSVCTCSTFLRVFPVRRERLVPFSTIVTTLRQTENERCVWEACHRTDGKPAL